MSTSGASALAEDATYPINQRETAYRLIIELLAYQLAFPVQWIETQNELLKRDPRISRFIEIGPQTTLATIANKSAARYYASHSPSQWSDLKFLSFHDNKDEIMYHYSDHYEDEKPREIPKSRPLTCDPPLSLTAPVTKPRTPRPRTAKLTTQRLLMARHVILAITAQKIQLPFYQVSMEKTIRELSAGKSTLQNELIGDLMAEFGRIPEGVEDIPLTSLADWCQTIFSGLPGTTMSTLISRLVSSKMPAESSQSSVERYLQSHFGFAKEHSAIVLCFATTVEPSTRLQDASNAYKFWDDIVSQYLEFEGIHLELGGVCDANNERSSISLDAATTEALNKDQNRLYREIRDLLSRHLQDAEQVPVDEDEWPESGLQQIQQLSDILATEFDDQFLRLIRPAFNLAQSRHYDSWWNWGREALVRWLYELLRGVSDEITVGVNNRLRTILNRWDETCTDIVTAALNRHISELSGTECVAGRDDVHSALNNILRLGILSQQSDPVYVYQHPALQPRVDVSSNGAIEYSQAQRELHNYADVARQKNNKATRNGQQHPFLHIRSRDNNRNWVYNSKGTALLHSMLDLGVTEGLTFCGKTVLITGAGSNSIGAEIVEGLLSGGARVIVSTSRPLPESFLFFQHIYRAHGAKGSSLTVLPVNQASKQDCNALIEYIYTTPSVSGGDLDFVIPFAAIPQAGEPESLNGRNELAFRAMLVNVLRLVGSVRREKERRRMDTRPTMFILPMSCNEGTFGGDGLYAESKIALKTLFNKFFSESWSSYITICGAVIGWTRGTNLMQAENMISEEMEDLGVLTFTQKEMAFNILALMTPAISELAEDAPVYADLTGGFDDLCNIKHELTAARQRVAQKVQLHEALREEEEHHYRILLGEPQEQPLKGQTDRYRGNLSLRLPNLPNQPDLVLDASNLEGMIDLSTTVVVVGFSELGPWGNARTRWEMEHKGEFTLEGYIEMAWIMGLIKHVDGSLDGEPYVGWLDAKSGEPIRDDEIPDRYHDHIMANSGVRIIAPSGLDSYHPSRKEFLQEVAVKNDLPPFECCQSSAQGFKLRHGERVTIEKIPGSDGIWRVFIKKGAVLMIPKTVPFSQIVAGTIPSGWDPRRYGIPQDIDVDPTTLYALCCVSEAFLSAGIQDPYEIYEYIQVSEIANCLGTSTGPMQTIQNMYRGRYLDKDVRDVISDHFLNTMGAWVNMLLISGSGPLKTPVGACATALESIDTGCEAIKARRCKIAIVGGCDDYREELAFEFAKIKATANSSEELAMGRLPGEISRPTASSRNGFAESSGCGVQILMNAELALKMGVPIYAVLAYTQMASDQVGRSIPSPGKGILSAARETEGEGGKNSPLLDIKFRRKCFDQEMAEIRDHCINIGSGNMLSPATFAQIQLSRVKEAQRRWANDIRTQAPGISPIRATLSTWGLCIDDIGVVSMHGTSTKANEVNECDVINTQMEYLSRQRGNPLLSVCQKFITGHPKAAAGAWQLNGCIQMMQEGIVPGNRNADNIDAQLRQYQHLLFPMESIQRPGLKAAMLTSFGFGQKGAVGIVVAPRYLFASIYTRDYENYRSRAISRQRTIDPTFASRIFNNSIVQVKCQPPWKDPGSQKHVLLDPDCRISSDAAALSCKSSGTHHNQKKTKKAVSHGGPSSTQSSRLSHTIQAMLEASSENAGRFVPTSVGIDVEEIASININSETFLQRNFTRSEREYCENSTNPHASFAGRWCAKEAVFKSLQTPSSGPGAAMHDIEIVSDNAVPRVVLHGNAQAVAAAKGFRKIEVTISHCAETAIAVAMATGNVPAQSIS
ncbi:hypothetical protein BDV59DRAFT_208020 [Aspergillus ambiguus]|uniref:uncharacterized protein n=1 Tax=Aspergillus ambiguus TaxID=176160 RepID=UPI003CCCC781